MNTFASLFTLVLLASSLDGKVIDRVVRGKMDEIQSCYQEGLDRRPGLKGKVTMKFKVDPDGSVHEAGLAKSTLRDEKVETCLAGVFETMQFPSFDPCPESETKTAKDCEISITYPLTFSPS